MESSGIGLIFQTQSEWRMDLYRLVFYIPFNRFPQCAGASVAFRTRSSVLACCWSSKRFMMYIIAGFSRMTSFLVSTVWLCWWPTWELVPSDKTHPTQTDEHRCAHQRVQRNQGNGQLQGRLGPTVAQRHNTLNAKKTKTNPA